MSEVKLPEHQFDQPVSGPAYRPFTKLVTINVVIGLFAYGTYVLSRRDDIAVALWWLVAMAALVVLVSGWYIVTGKTTIDAKGIRQDWMFTKSYRWHEISRARFIRLPFSGRLMLVTGQGPIKAVHSGNATLDRAFRDIAAFYGGARKR